MACALDRREGTLGMAGLTLEQVLGDAGLHVDAGERMGDDVVQFARDSQSFLFGASLRFFFSSSLGELGALEQQPYVRAVVSQRLACKHGDSDQGGVADRLQRQRVRVATGEE